MSAPAIPVPAGGEATGGGAAPGAVRKGGWFVRITILAIVILWSIPTLGVLITSVRTEDAVNTTGWWTTLTPLLWFLPPVLVIVGAAVLIRSRTIGPAVVLMSVGVVLFLLLGVWGVDFSFPAEWTIESYQEALDAGGFASAFLNSLAVTLPATVIPIAIAAFAAYAFSWMEFRGRYVMFVAVVGLLVVPLQMALIPIIRLYTQGVTLFGLQLFPDLDLNESFLGIWLAHTGFGLPLATYLLRNYIGSLPSSIIESAKIDGADHFTIFWRLIVPLSVPALAAFAIFQFMWVWNDLLVAYVFLGGAGQNRVLTVALRGLVGTAGENWHLLTAAAFISMSLPLVVFFSLQKYFVRGLTAGSVKG